jgi:hypothetical protein
MIRNHHIKLISSHAVKHSIRGGAGLVFVLITLLVGLVTASIVISPLEAFEKSTNAELNQHRDLGIAERAGAQSMMNEKVLQIGSKAIEWSVDPSPAQLNFLTQQKPVMVSAILVLLLLVTPLFACLGGFNQTSSDIASKGLRFLLIRTERENIFIGRLVGTFLFTTVVFGVLFVVLAAYSAIKIKVHPAGDMLLWFAGCYIRTVIFAMPYVALCSWISCSFESAFGSLMISLLIAYVAPLFFMLAGNINEGARYLQYTTPWGYKWWLLDGSIAKLGAGIAVMLGFTALFFTLGLRTMKKRDL